MEKFMKKILGVILIGICLGGLTLSGGYIGFAIIVILLTFALHLIIGTD